MMSYGIVLTTQEDGVVVAHIQDTIPPLESRTQNHRMRRTPKNDTCMLFPTQWCCLDPSIVTRASGSARLRDVPHVVVPQVSRQMIFSRKPIFVFPVAPRHRAIDIQWIRVMLGTIVTFKTGPPSEYATAIQADPLLFTAARGVLDKHNGRYADFQIARETYPDPSPWVTAIVGGRS
jgi:hypothetical protein